MRTDIVSCQSTIARLSREEMKVLMLEPIKLVLNIMVGKKLTALMNLL